jgi:hypothetical protein
MSFESEGTASTSASPADVWHLWADVGSWHCWNADVQRVALEGHFAEGAAGTLCMADDVEAPFVLEIVEPGSRFLDRITIGEVVIHVDHEVKAAADGSEVIMRTFVSGPGADDIGPRITANTPKALAALVELAEQRA